MQPEEGLTLITERFYLNEKKLLGKGCYGQVYEGFDKQKKKKIAIKHMNKPENFQDEVQTLEKLSSLVHPNIMGFYGFQATGDDVYLFVQYCPGGVLTDLIKKGLSQEEVLDLFREIIEGMCYMNAKGRMHRDLKPDNILIGTRGDIKISDFGLARQYGLDVTGQMGTPLYAGPEVYTNFTQNYNQNCDVWGAGLILHEMLTMKHPFDYIKTIAQLKAEWKMYQKGEKSVKYSPDYHPQWEYITNIMLTHNFKKRPTFHDILEIFKKVDDNGNMRKEIKNIKLGIKQETNSRQSLVENYLNFIDQKADILTDLVVYLNQKTYPLLRPSIQNLLIFLAMARYVSRMKKIVRSLKFKTLKFPNDEELLERGNPDSSIVLLIEKYRNVFQTKSTKYQNYLKQKMIPVICDLYNSNDEDRNIYKSLETSFKLVLQMKDGGMDIEQNYIDEYKKVLIFHKTKPTNEKMSNMDINLQEIYMKILLPGFLDDQFPDKMFSQRDFVKNKLRKLTAIHPQQLVQTITRLRKVLH